MINFDKYLPIPTKESILLQIGANDGIQDDPVRDYILHHKINAHLLEPIPVFYDELCKNYKDAQNVTCHNCAIHIKNGKENITYVNVPSLPNWTKGLGTFDITKNGLSGYGNYKLQTDLTNDPTFLSINNQKKDIEVNTYTLSTFLLNAGIDRIDVYVTDTEGFDGIIFDQLDLDKYSPSFIMMETHTLGDEANYDIDNKLKNYNYTIVEKGWDTVAIKND
jgi:FkbM family methyltransferase